MDCLVHGVPKSWTTLSDFHFISLHGWPAPQRHDSASFGGHGGFQPLLPGSPSRSFRWLCIFLFSPTGGAALCSSPAPAGGLRVDTGLRVLGGGLTRAKPHYWRNLGTGQEISAGGRPRDQWGTVWAMASRSTVSEIGVTLPVDSPGWPMCSPKPQLPTLGILSAPDSPAFVKLQAEWEGTSAGMRRSKGKDFTKCEDWYLSLVKQCPPLACLYLSKGEVGNWLHMVNYLLILYLAIEHMKEAYLQRSTQSNKIKYISS